MMTTKVKSKTTGRPIQKCTECNEPSLPGLVQGQGKCQYHWNAGVWGKKWADEVKAREATEQS